MTATFGRNVHDGDGDEELPRGDEELPRGDEEFDGDGDEELQGELVGEFIYGINPVYTALRARRRKCFALYTKTEEDAKLREALAKVIAAAGECPTDQQCSLE